jgi:hypothetical protein
VGHLERNEERCVTDPTPSPERPDRQQLAFTREQSHLVQVLRSRDGQFRTKIAEMYIGALHAVAEVSNPERHSQAAQSIRELLDKLSRQHDGSVIQLERTWASDYLGQIASDLEKAWENSQCYDRTERAWAGEIDSSLRRLLMRVEEAVHKHRSNPRNREVQRRFLRGLEPPAQPLPSDEEEQLLEQWKRFDKFFQDVAHHNRFPDAQEFEQRLGECTTFLLARLRLTTSATLTLLDELIAEAESDA